MQRARPDDLAGLIALAVVEKEAIERGEGDVLLGSRRRRRRSTRHLCTEHLTHAEGCRRTDVEGESAPLSLDTKSMTDLGQPNRLTDDATPTSNRRSYGGDGRSQFTQEDPLGLAGGMNAYGFGNGDPVNYGDPFGLCGHKGENPCPPAALAVGGTAALPEVGVGSAGVGAELASGGVLALATGEAYLALRPAFPGSGKVGLGRGQGTWAAEATETNGVPELPDSLTGENPREGSGNRINTNSKRDPQEIFDELTGGQSETQPNGHQVGPNGVRLRPGTRTKGPRIDIPAKPPRPHKTIHSRLESE